MTFTYDDVMKIYKPNHDVDVRELWLNKVGIQGDEWYINPQGVKLPLLWMISYLQGHGKVFPFDIFPKFDPNVRDGYGKTFLDVGYLHLHPEYLHTLIDFGFDIDNPGNRDDIQLLRHGELIRVLISAGVVFNSYSYLERKALLKREYVRRVCATFLLSNLLVKDLLKIVAAIIWRSARYPEKWE